MRRTLIGTAIGMAFAGAASLAVAQQAPGDKDKRPAAQDRAPEGKGQRGPGATQQRGTEGPKAIDRPKATERPDRDRPKATERPDRDRPKATERPGRDRPKATERPDRDRPKATERPDRDRPKAARPETDKDRRVRISEKQRSDVRARLRRTRVDTTRLNVRVNVGSRIPRSVRLYPLPAAIFAVAPAYRGYSYLVLEDDTIVIVDAGTYMVVDVIPAGTRRAGGERGGSLALSAEERHLIYSRVPKDRTVNVRVRLALGARVPGSVELLRFPGELVERIPELRRYRFVVTDEDDDVVIVDPIDHHVVLVISK